MDMEVLRKNSFVTDLLYCGCIFIFSVLIAWPLLKGKFLIGDDYDGVVILLACMKSSLGHGQ